jgi:hypothetical protein
MDMVVLSLHWYASIKNNKTHPQKSKNPRDIVNIFSGMRRTFISEENKTERQQSDYMSIYRPNFCGLN